MSTDAIVAGTDGSRTAERAVDKAGELAQALGAAVHVVCVPGAIAGQDWPQRITAQQIVAEADERLRQRGISVQTHLPKDQGDAALALVAVAEHVKAQMIVVGNRGMTGIRRLLGSLPNRVSHQAQCNVLIVPTQSSALGEYVGHSIVVGTDGSSSAMQAVKEAARLAKALGGSLQIVSATATPEQAESALSAAAAQVSAEGVDAATHAREGDAVDALLDVAATHDAAMVVVGSKGMHAAERDRFGNIPNRLSHKGASSVLIVFTGEPTGGDDEALTALAAGEAISSGEDVST